MGLTQVTSFKQKVNWMREISFESELWITVTCELKTDIFMEQCMKLAEQSILLCLHGGGKLWIWNTCLYYSNTLLPKQGTFLYEAWPDSAEKRDILNTRNFNISGIWYWKSVHWWIVHHQWIQNIAFSQTVTHSWMGGIRRREIEQTQN